MSLDYAITYTSLNLSGEAVESRERMSNFTPHLPEP